MTIGSVAAATMQWLCDKAYVGYSQYERGDIRDGGSMDCSSGAAYSYNAGGVNPPFPADTSTHNFRERAAARGFAILDYAAVGPNPDNLAVGDALLSELASGGVGHIAVVTGYDTLSEAWISEIGDIYGEPGDQTGDETRTVTMTSHPLTLAGSWTHLLRPPAGGDDTATTQTTQTTPAAPATTTITTQEDTMYLIRTVTPWGEYAYATINLAGIGGAAAKTQAEADYLYPVIGVRPVGWETYNELVRLAWVAHTEALASIGRTMSESIDDAVRRVTEATRPATEVTA